MPIRLPLLRQLLLTAAVAACAAADPGLAPDPAVLAGRLDNGLRWYAMANQQPKGKASLRLRIASGSLQERDEQRGLAHYLEHMAFNGSTHFPAGTLIKSLQDMGIAFGQHSNAHTGQDETVYKLDLPDAAPGTLEKGLLLLADQAGGLLLAAEEVEREKGVILAEMRDKEGPGWREYQAMTAVVARGTRAPTRFPIGTETTVKGATRALLVDYYDHWYRPERMDLAVVGALEPAAVAPLVKKLFGGMAARAPAEREPDLGTPPAGLQVLVHREAEANGTRAGIWLLRRQPRPDDGADLRRGEVARDLAEAVLGQRLARLAQEDKDCPILGAGPFSHHEPEGYVRAGLQAQVRPGRAVDAIALLERELRRMIVHGPTATELATEVARHRTALEQAVAGAGNRTNAALASAIVSSAGERRTFLSPAQDLALQQPWLAALTPADCRAAYARTWEGASALSVTVTGADDLGASGEATVRAAWQAAHAETPAAPVERVQAAFAYATRPDPGAIAQADAAPYAIRRLRFANGVAANLMRLTWQKDQVQVTFRFDIPSDAPAGVREFAGMTVVAGGLGRHSVIELSTLLAGRGVGMPALGIGDGSATLGLSCRSAELELALQLLRAGVVDPGWREEAGTMAKARWKTALEARASDLDAQVALAFERLTVGDDAHRRSATAAEAERVDLAAVKAWFAPRIAAAPLTVTVAGDIDPAKAEELVAAYAGSLPKRPAPAAWADPAAGLLPATPPRRERVAIEVPGAAARALVQVAWPTVDYRDPRVVRRLGLLASAFSERLREELRERLGQAYSPYAYHQASETRQGQGFLLVRAEVAPDQAGKAEEAIRAIAAALAKDGLDESQLGQVKNPLVKELGAIRQTNRFWFRAADEAQNRPFRLDWLAGQEADYAAVTAEDLSALAKIHLAGAPVTVVGVCKGK